MLLLRSLVSLLNTLVLTETHYSPANQQGMWAISLIPGMGNVLGATQAPSIEVDLWATFTRWMLIAVAAVSGA